MRIRNLANLPPIAKTLLIVAADVLVLPLALWSAVALRLGELPLSDGPPAWGYMLAVVVTLPLFLHFGLYRAVIRYLETRAFVLVIGVSLGAAALFALIALFLRIPNIPRSALIIYAVMSAGYATLARLLARQVLRGAMPPTARVGLPVAIYGAGSAGRQLAQALRSGPEFRPRVFVDDSMSLQGRSIMGLPVHSSQSLSTLIEQYRIGTVIVAIPSLSAGQRADLLRRLQPLSIEVRLVPGMADLIRNELAVSDVREVRPEDLLGRDAVQLDTDAIAQFLENSAVMVTGAGGSIGSELCRQIARYRPRLLVLFEMSEFALYTLREEFVALFPDVPLVCAVGDVKNSARVDEIMAAHAPAAVFHAAAYKHVPLMEEVNAWEALRNNTYGTYVVGQAAIRHGVQKFVLVSTDKAVNPTNVMGASKRLAELVCQALHQENKTRFEIVRFGNVLGSSGSVIPKFRDQIAAGGPITVTHPDIVRFFMSIPEAAQLVLQAACMGRGGEVFVLDMGEPVKIVDLARNMIRLSGYAEAQIGIEFTGLRPGEKLFEELLADTEFSRATSHPKIRVARVAYTTDDGWKRLKDWIVTDGCFSDDDVRRNMAELLMEYRPWSA
ncbi:MAG: nucleoside-diphosphate sugar epimerase/dehydratase [Burkholderiales bacterium]